MVPNPANTSALILKEFAPSMPEKNISCLTRLDHNRALGVLLSLMIIGISSIELRCDVSLVYSWDY